MAVRTITTRLTLDGEKQWKKEMADINSALKTQASELKAVQSEYRHNADSVEALTAKGDVLRRQYEQQEEKVRQLRRAVEDATEAFGENDRRVDSYRQSLNSARVQLDRLNDALRENERELDDARKAADDAADSVGDYGREANDAGGTMGGFGSSIDGVIGKLGSLKGALIGGAVVGAVKELAEGIMDIEESTREYRSIMGSLEVSSANAGYTAEQTAQTFAQLQNVLGDTQQAATATANLQAVGLEQEKLTKLVDGAIGAWATYGDSIPIDSLAEAINETIQAGKVTGTFADLLNWAGQSEDEFNLKLEEAATAAERADLVLQMMANQGLVQAAEGWRTVNEDIIDANESQRKLDEAWGEMGEAVEPVATFLRETLAGAISFTAEAVEGLVGWIEKAVDWLGKIRDTEKEFEVKVYEQYYADKYGYDGSHAGGLDYVPYDGYIAQLHKGERVLTATEAQQQTLTEAGMGQLMAQMLNAMEAGTSPQELVLHVTTQLGGATVDEQIYRCNLRAQERHGTALVK